MVTAHQVVFAGIKEGFTREQVLLNLVALFKLPESSIQTAIASPNFVFKKGLTAERAALYQAKLEPLGCLVRIELEAHALKEAEAPPRATESQVLRKVTTQAVAIEANTSEDVPDSGSRVRKVDIWLFIGIVFIPLIFSWFLLRKGYSLVARIVAFVWLALSVWLMGEKKISLLQIAGDWIGSFGATSAIVIIVFVSFFVIVKNGIKKAKTLENDRRLLLNSQSNFTPNQWIWGDDGRGIALDEQRQKLCLASFPQGARVVTYRQILSAEVFEDGASITKTMRLSQVGGAVVGGLLLGGVGAVVGSLTGKKETRATVNRVELRVIVDDTQRPLHDVILLNRNVKRTDPAYITAIGAARRWVGIVEVLVKRADSDAADARATHHAPRSVLPPASMADELKKLHELKTAGILSADEFQQQKVRLLG
jgi:hypothetical protein